MKIPKLNDITEAHKRINKQINRTPVLTSETINRLVGAELFFKCENFQKVGAFKFRGASNATLSLADEKSSRGFATHSSGNHAQALALAARMKGMPAYIVMPNNSPDVKINAVRDYGAKIYFCEPTLEARENTLKEVVADTGAAFIHPYDNFHIIAGQGGVALELLEDAKGLDCVIAPVGGGGLLSGVSIAVKSLSPKTIVIAAEPEGADDAFRSLSSGELQPSVNPDTVCDGLLTSLSPLTFSIIRKNVSEIVTVSDEFTIKAMRLAFERMKIIIEPSAAITLGLILQKKINLAGKKTGVIFSGGNVDLEKLPWNL